MVPLSALNLEHILRARLYFLPSSRRDASAESCAQKQKLCFPLNLTLNELTWLRCLQVQPHDSNAPRTRRSDRLAPRPALLPQPRPNARDRSPPSSIPSSPIPSSPIPRTGLQESTR